MMQENDVLKNMQSFAKKAEEFASLVKNDIDKRYSSEASQLIEMSKALSKKINNFSQVSHNDSIEKSYQDRIKEWVYNCFGSEISKDKEERNHRFLEEALELVQALGCTQHEALQLVNYVYERPVGEPSQEVGGVMVTLAALCSCHELNMMECGEIELARIWTKIDTIRAKHAAKPKHSPLPE